MKLLTYSLALALLVCSEGFAQFDGYSATNHVVVKYSPLPMFDFDNTIQFGVEVPLGNSGWSVQQDLGYGHSKFNIWYYDNANPPNKATYKSRTHFRWYYYTKRRVRAYVGGEYLFKKVIYRDNQWVGMDCSGFGGCGYFENKNVKIGRAVSAGHIRGGWQFYFSNRMTLDLFTGFGMRLIKVKSLTPGLTNANFSAPDEFWVNNSVGSEDLVPSVVLGVHFGIMLGKFREPDRR
jgi:hypothetical protein